LQLLQLQPVEVQVCQPPQQFALLLWLIWDAVTLPGCCFQQHISRHSLLCGSSPICSYYWHKRLTLLCFDNLQHIYPW
jgi:hypothetical protein